MGGPIVKNKFFYFLDAERTLQHEQAPVLVAAPFQQYSGSFSSPFHENNLMAKADYQLIHSVHAFYRFGYFQNSFNANGGSGFSVYDGKNVTRTHVAGFDFNTGSFTHSIRFGYLKTELQHVDATSGSNLPLANYPLKIQMGNTGLITGPSGRCAQDDTTERPSGQVRWQQNLGFAHNPLRFRLQPYRRRRLCATSDPRSRFCPRMSVHLKRLSHRLDPSLAATQIR